MEWLFTGESLAALLTLTLMEVVLGIDNIVFITIQTDKLPKEQQKKARVLGLAFALLTRLILLFSITWVMSLTKPLFNIANWFTFLNDFSDSLAISGRDLILLLGGLFLIYKSIREIYEMMEGSGHGITVKKLSFVGTIIQIGILDIVFGLDSVITAVGMAKHIEIMVIAVVISMIFMMFFIHKVSDFINKHPSIKILALSFLLLIGITLIAESIDQHIAKGYIYFSMAFSIFVISLIIKIKPKEYYNN